MKKMIMIQMLLLISLTAHAQKAQLLLIDPDIEARELENFNIQRGSTHVSSIPDRDAREDFFHEVSKVQEWDELKKDIFYMELERKSVDQLHKKYPELTKKEIKALKDRR